jgi:enamine deaminase RidA (YjgF/YER057c/UK114 family)
MTEIIRIDPGARMSEATVYGDRIYSAGVVADKTLGKSVFEQTTEILEQIDALLAGLGSDKTKILKANIWLADITTFAEMNKAWDAWVVPQQGPARATVEGKLANPGYAVEIMIEAVK